MIGPKEDGGRKPTKRRRKGQEEVTLEYALEVRKVAVYHPGDELDVEREDPRGEEDLRDQGQPSDPPALDPKPVQKHSVHSFFGPERGTMGNWEEGDPKLSQNLNQHTAEANPTADRN